MRIEILSPAEEDLEEGYRFYESQADSLGSYFLDSLYSDIDSLAYFAGMHRVVLGYHRLLSRRFPFSVYYRTTELLWTFGRDNGNSSTGAGDAVAVDCRSQPCC